GSVRSSGIDPRSNSSIIFPCSRMMHDVASMQAYLESATQGRRSDSFVRGVTAEVDKGQDNYRECRRRRSVGDRANRRGNGSLCWRRQFSRQKVLSKGPQASNNRSHHRKDRSYVIYLRDLFLRVCPREFDSESLPPIAPPDGAAFLLRAFVHAHGNRLNDADGR